MDSFNLDGGISPLRFDASSANSSVNTNESLTDILGTPSLSSGDFVGAKNFFEFSDATQVKENSKRSKSSFNLVSDLVIQKHKEEKKITEEKEIHSTFKADNFVHDVENDVFEKSETLHPVDLQSYELSMASSGRNRDGKLNLKGNKSKDISASQEKISGVASIDHRSCHNKRGNNANDIPHRNAALKQEKRKVKTKGKERGVNLKTTKNASFITHQERENIDLCNFTDHGVSSEKENSLHSVKCMNVGNSSTKRVNTSETQIHQKLEDTVPTQDFLTNEIDTESAGSTDKHSSPIYHYQLSVETIIQDCISSESDKIRQHLYLQHMSFYRHLNKMTEKIEKQNVVMSEQLLKSVEELSKINLSLKNAAIV